ncbi:hypothetical protein SAMN06265795_113110 [Noviherbaspirillum humi]|uniref:Polysaccharide deacetylase n=1 Tax=Noviherbaspirillum humi TaxID=1688639 RepID=A0A239JV48_9BURK|nr:hypothetical protein [Noviherbaspirillum humi]SNT09318.1 hypothetical protein SAMN06265795_113110 [Noviherbaspirillum humi]
MLKDQFDALYQEGAQRPTVMAIPLHPFIMGHPFRARYLAEALATMAAKPGIWFAKGSEIGATLPSIRSFATLPAGCLVLRSNLHFAKSERGRLPWTGVVRADRAAAHLTAFLQSALIAAS